MCIEHVIGLEKEEILEPGVAIDQKPPPEKPEAPAEENEETKLSFDSDTPKQEIGAFIDKTIRMPTLGRQSTFAQM